MSVIYRDIEKERCLKVKQTEGFNRPRPHIYNNTSSNVSEWHGMKYTRIYQKTCLPGLKFRNNITYYRTSKTYLYLADLQK